MRIEINAGGLGGGVAIAEYQLNMANFITQSEDVIDAFKAVRTSTYNLSGGVGNLSGAVSDLSSRITEEEQNKNSATEIRRQSNEFLDLAIRVDKQVATLVKQNSEKFYQVHPWLRPPVPEEDKPWYEKAWDFLCDTVSDVVEDVKESWEKLKEFVGVAWESLKSTVKALWTSVSTWVSEHIVDIVKIAALVAIAVGAILLTGVIMSSLTGIGLVLAVAGLHATSGALSSLVENVADQYEANGRDWSKVDWSEAGKEALFGAAVGAVTGIVGAGLGSLFTDILKSTKLIGPLINSSSKTVRILSGIGIGGASEVGSGIFSRFSGSAVRDIMEDGDFDGDNLLKETFDPKSILFDFATGGTMGGIEASKPYTLRKTNMYSDSYFAGGDNQAEFMDYYKNRSTKFELTSIDNASTEYISALDIEGIPLSKAEVKNMDGFWTRHGLEGYSKQNILDNASLIGDVKMHLDNGATLESLSNSSAYSKTVDSYFLKPVEVAKVDNFYVFQGDGRHRILAAKELRINIPVKITEIWTKK
ncbi:MAG: hypothetical protein IKL47_02970 [Clostridia bacterium]|nr:hypothetical protein [Clostridia bacterium]